MGIKQSITISWIQNQTFCHQQALGNLSLVLLLHMPVPLNRFPSGSFHKAPQSTQKRHAHQPLTPCIPVVSTWAGRFIKIMVAGERQPCNAGKQQVEYNREKDIQRRFFCGNRESRLVGNHRSRIHRQYPRTNCTELAFSSSEFGKSFSWCGLAVLNGLKYL